jgi:hypothetical protein
VANHTPGKPTAPAFDLSGMTQYGIGGMTSPAQGMSNYDALKQSIEDYKMHSGLIGSDGGSPLDLTKYQSALSQWDQAKGSDIGKALMGGGGQASMEQGKTGNQGLVANAMSDYMAKNIHKVSDKMKPMEYAGPVAGNSTAPGVTSAGTEQEETQAPLQTNRLASRTGIIGARM